MKKHIAAAWHILGNHLRDMHTRMMRNGFTYGVVAGVCAAHVAMCFSAATLGFAALIFVSAYAMLYLFFGAMFVIYGGDQ